MGKVGEGQAADISLLRNKVVLLHCQYTMIRLIHFEICAANMIEYCNCEDLQVVLKVILARPS